MTGDNSFDVVIIGGSYAGLSAAMALGRAMRKVLIIDSGLPCNRQTPHSHNFITHDGVEPALIAQKAKEQVLQYGTVKFHDGLAVDGRQTADGFVVVTEAGLSFNAKKLIVATGIKDIMPGLKGFSECWGISVIHCPYCHGYEVRNEKTGILANGEAAFHYAQLIYNWTKDLTVFTNGGSLLTPVQADTLAKHNIAVIEKEIAALAQENGHIRQIVFKDNSVFALKAVYARPSFEQHCKIPELLGCELTEQGLLKTDMFQETTVKNIFACGDNASLLRSVANAVASGNMAGARANNMLAAEAF
ncbi:MAG: NAD(P)/FAD-dependent oxidoreductase [Flavihumibacter sp.]